MNRKLEYDRAYARAHRDERREANLAWRQQNVERVRANEAKRRLEKRALCLVATARTRSRLRALSFDLDEHVGALQARIDLGRFELSGMPFDLSPGRKAFSPSFDRIDPKQGYLFKNIRIVCHAMNVSLGDWGPETSASILRAWQARYDTQATQ